MKLNRSWCGTVVAVWMVLRLTGCGSSASSVDDAPGLRWPPPPDEPRIAYVATYVSDDQFSSGLGDVIKALGGSAGGVRLNTPFDVCSDDSGSVYVSDLTAGVIRIDTVRREMTLLGERSPVPMGNPRGICYGHGRLFVGLPDVGQVGVFTTNGDYLSMIGRPGGFPNPLDVAYDASRRRVVIVDNKLHAVCLYSVAGDSLMTIGTRGSNEGQFNYPQSVALDAQGNIYVVDAFNFRIQVFDPEGKFLRTFGKQGNVFGTFMRPKGIALDTYGNIYVLDGVHQNFQIFNQGGELLMFVGKFSAANDGFQNPVSICIDRRNMIYVTDQLNQRLQVFRLLKGD